ncbi:MAG: carboxymuconolactone decarboxylase family protein [Candidatus Dadabacteria bacterium]|nr:MAG: carboxymuconolactone decarboxylase family protein [Candidatus Dadabacteria bacterium]
MSEERKEKILNDVKDRFGFIPNVINKLALNPAVAEFYLRGAEILASGHLSQPEQQLVCLAVSAANGCEYCMAAHAMTCKGAGIPSEDIAAIREGREPRDARYAKLSKTVRLLIEKRGWLTEDDILNLNISREELYEIIALLALKTVTNYVNHIEHTEIDPQFTD